MIQWIVFPWENPSEGVRVSSGHLREAEAPTEAAAENLPKASGSQKHRPRRQPRIPRLWSTDRGG